LKFKKIILSDRKLNGQNKLLVKKYMEKLSKNPAKQFFATTFVLLSKNHNGNRKKHFWSTEERKLFLF
jgi:hypothetical protein